MNIPKICVGTMVHPLGKAHPTAQVVSDLGGAWLVVRCDNNVTEVWYKHETARWLLH